jgi:hypothetical protein
MKRFSMQFVSLVLLSGLTAFCITNSVHHRTLNSTQPVTSQPLALSPSAPLNALTNLADGTDPVPAPMPLPHILSVSTGVFAVDGTDPVPAPMPLPHVLNATADTFAVDGTDPVPAPMPLPHVFNFNVTAGLIADGTDPVPGPDPVAPRRQCDCGHLRGRRHRSGPGPDPVAPRRQCDCGHLRGRRHRSSPSPDAVAGWTKKRLTTGLSQPS